MSRFLPCILCVPWGHSFCMAWTGLQGGDCLGKNVARACYRRPFVSGADKPGFIGAGSEIHTALETGMEETPEEFRVAFQGRRKIANRRIREEDAKHRSALRHLHWESFGA